MEKPKRLSKEELAGLTDAELAKCAAEHKIDLTTARTREDVMVLIDLHQEDADKLAKSGKPPEKPVRAGASARRGKKPEGAELTGEQIVSVQRVWAQFSRNIPQPAISSGSWEIEKDKRKEAADHDVPDGDYRIIGADWILTFINGRFVEAARGGPNTRADSYAAVPATEHPIPPNA